MQTCARVCAPELQKSLTIYKKKVLFHSVLKDNPSDLFQLNFWGGMPSQTESLQIKFAKWIKALKDWDGGEDLLMEKPSSL